MNGPRTIDVRPAVELDRAAITGLLTRSFWDDPVIMWMFPDESVRRTKLPRFYDLLWVTMLPDGGCDVTSGTESATMWNPPGKWQLPLLTLLRHAPRMIGAFGTALPRALRLLHAMDAVHPAEPHWYLNMVGTEPGLQGRGFGGAAIRSRLAKCDATGLSAFLISSKESNIPVYRALGFDVTGEIVIPDGPTLWPMLRPPQSAD
jgi:GNAT superfamily N-acetyltransferase